MKIALISDIHGNMPAFEAVLDDIVKRNADKIICLGDMIGKGPNSREVVEICKNKCDIVLLGNWEDGTYQTYENLKREQTDQISQSVLWYINNIGEDKIDYIGNLPHSYELYLSGRLIRMFHAHPQNFNRYFADSPIDQRLELFEYGNSAKIKLLADVAVYADIHTAYSQVIHGRQLLNVGSVGNPLDICQASYVILEGDEEAAASFSIQFIRVPYDITLAVNLAKQYEVPHLEGYIRELETAVYFKRGM